MAPIFEYQCDLCQGIFEKLMYAGENTLASQCPVCLGVGHKVMSAPAIVYNYYRPGRPDLLPDWKQKNAEWEAHDRALPPMKGDKGGQTKVYDFAFGKAERKQLEAKAQLDNI